MEAFGIIPAKLKFKGSDTKKHKIQGIYKNIKLYEKYTRSESHEPKTSARWAKMVNKMSSTLELQT